MKKFGKKQSEQVLNIKIALTKFSPLKEAKSARKYSLKVMPQGHF